MLFRVPTLTAGLDIAVISANASAIRFKLLVGPVPIGLGALLLFDFYSMNSDLKKIEECREIIRTSNSAEVVEEATQTLEKLSRSVDIRLPSVQLFSAQTVTSPSKSSGGRRSRRLRKTSTV